MAWKDAVGTTVGTGDQLRIPDANGYWWFLSPDTAEPDFERHVFGPITQPQYYLTTDCTGPYYIMGPLPPPRVPFSYGNSASWRVRADDAVFQQLIYKSSKGAAAVNCTTAPSFGTLAMLMAEASIPIVAGLTPPELGLTPPLHLERLP